MIQFQHQIDRIKGHSNTLSYAEDNCLDVLDEILDLIESVSEGFLTYSYVYVTCACISDLLY